MYKYFNAKGKLKKIFNYFSIFTIIFGTTFGSINNSFAATIALDFAGADSGVAATEATAASADTVTLTGDEQYVLGDAETISALTNVAESTAAATLDISGNTLTITNDITSIANASIAVTVDADDGLVVTGSVIENATASFVTITLESGASATFNGATAEAVGSAIDGSAAGLGTVAVTAAGPITFSDTVGTTLGLAAVNIGTATDDSAAVFQAAIKATTVTLTSGEASGESSTATFDKIVGNLVLTDGADDASHVTATFNNSTAQTAVSGTITATDTEGDDTFITVVDSASGAAAAQTFAGQVGTSTNKIGTITVGAASGNAGIATFSSDVYSTNLSVISGGSGENSTVTLGGSLTATTTTLNDDTGLATLIVSGTGTTVAGTIDGAGDGEGTLQITGASTTISGAVGKIESKALKAIDINATSTFGGASEATTYTVDADTTFTGAVTANTSFAVATSGTDVTLTAASSTGTTTLASGTSITANGILTTGDITVTSGKLYLNVASNVADNIILAGTAELHIGKAFVTTNNINTSSTSDGEGNFASTAKIYLPSNLTSGETLKITDSGAFDEGDATKTAVTTAAAVNTILQDTALVDYSASAASEGATVITITATDRTNTAVASQLGTTTNVGTAALKLMAAMDANDTSGDTAAYTAFDNALKAQGGYSATEDTSFLQQTAPQDDMISGSTVATRAMTGTVQGIMSSRMASLRSGDAYFGTGMSAGAMMSANSGFIQAFGTEAEQKNKKVGSGTQYGYDSNSSGIAIGFDGINDNGTVVGLSLSMSETDVDGKGTGKAKNDIDSYTASIYMDKATDSGYIEGSLTVGLNENNSSRLVNTAGLSRTYKGSYDSQQVSLKIGGGVPNSVGNNGYVTPFGSITGTIIETDAYTETSTTSSDSLRLRVAQDDVSSVVGTVGVKYHNVMSNGGVPMISLAINNEFGDDTINSTNTYQGGGTSFTTSTAVEELSATLGLGYSMGNDVSSVEFAYEANVNDDDYLGHYGSFKIVTKF